MPQSLEDVCRLCLSKERMMFPIFQSHLLKNGTTFRNKIMSCASVEIFADDDLPSKVCYVCLHQVEKFFQFQEMCENSDLVLRLQLKTKTPQERDTADKNTNSDQALCEGEKNNFVQEYYLDSGNLKNFDGLTCSTCSSVFLSTSLLVEHLKKDHPDENMFACKNCKISFSTATLFKNHLNTQHNLTCNKCDCAFKHENNLKDHVKNHLNEYLQCKFCLKTYSNIYEMKKHEHSHFIKTCCFCNKELDSENDYNSHYKVCDQRHHCKFCKQTFKFKKNLIEHVNSQHDSSGLEKTGNYKQPVVLDEMQEIRYESEDDMLLKCKNCQVRFTDESSLVDHMATEHDDTVLTCRFCAKKFGLRTSLKRHERSHSGIKPYQCKFCPRKFKDSSACVVHTRTHTGEHPFRCQECHKDFKQLANLKMHTYRHHKKNKKSADVKSVILNEGRSEYQPLYGENLMESYSSNNMRGFQGLNNSISTNFNQGINILMSNHHSA